jgi:hypothetical protein
MIAGLVMVHGKFMKKGPNTIYSRFFPSLFLASRLDGSLGTMAGVTWALCEQRCSSLILMWVFIRGSAHGIAGSLTTSKNKLPLRTTTSSVFAAPLPHFSSRNSWECSGIALLTESRDGRERRREIQLELTEHKMVRLTKKRGVPLLLEGPSGLPPSCQSALNQFERDCSLLCGRFIDDARDRIFQRQRSVMPGH